MEDLTSKIPKKKPIIKKKAFWIFQYVWLVVGEQHNIFFLFLA